MVAVSAVPVIQQPKARGSCQDQSELILIIFNTRGYRSTPIFIPVDWHRGRVIKATHFFINSTKLSLFRGC